MLLRSLEPSSTRGERLAKVVGAVALVGWAAWWLASVYQLRLPWGERTWMRVPAFGVDFWTQSEYAARRFLNGISPYAEPDHLFHYPPVVIRLFLWVGWFTPGAALRIWVAILAAIMIAGTFAACRSRRDLGLTPLHPVIALPLVLLSFPVVFALERANFDLITLLAILLAVPLMRRGTGAADFAAGALLSLGPWVKIYPGVLGAGLVSLRRWKALAGFVVGGLAIGLATPRETLWSFRVIREAIRRVQLWALFPGEYGAWTHSLPIAWIRFRVATAGTPIGALAQRIPPWCLSVVVVVPLLAWVCLRIYRSRGDVRVAYPLFLWLVSLASFVPDIANDYSLAPFPLAAVAVVGMNDPLPLRLSLLPLLLWWQPISLPISGIVVLVIKLVGVAAVGVALTLRAESLAVAPPEAR
jgi:hypothetical protein